MQRNQTMIQSFTLARYTTPPSAELEITFKSGYPQEAKAVEIFRDIARHPALDNDSLTNFGVMGNLLGLTYAETHAILLDEASGCDLKPEYLDKWLQTGFYSLKENIRA